MLADKDCKIMYYLPLLQQTVQSSYSHVVSVALPVVLCHVNGTRECILLWEVPFTITPCTLCTCTIYKVNQTVTLHWCISYWYIFPYIDSNLSPPPQENINWSSAMYIRNQSCSWVIKPHHKFYYTGSAGKGCKQLNRMQQSLVQTDRY